MLFKILKGDSSRISTDVTPFHEGYAYVTANDGGFYIDMNNGTADERIRINPTATQVAMKKWTADDFLPTKGDLITMNLDGTDRQYRVLKRDGNVAEVLTMWNVSTRQQFHGSRNVYSGSDLDTYLNSTWYNTLSSDAKNAIVPKNITQDSWYFGSSGSPQYSGTCGDAVPGRSSYTISKGSDNYSAIGSRYVYAMSVQEVLDYLSDNSVLVDTSGMLRNQNIWKMFWNRTTEISEYPWLRSATAGRSGYACYVYGFYGRLSLTDVYDDYAVRGALQIDLSKIPFTIGG